MMIYIKKTLFIEYKWGGLTSFEIIKHKKKGNELSWYKDPGRGFSISLERVRQYWVEEI